MEGVIGTSKSNKKRFEMNTHRVLFLVFLIVAAASDTRAQVIVPIQRADLVSPTITATTSFNSGTGLYTYSYTIKNKNGAQQNLEKFIIKTGAKVLNAASPQGWSFDSGGEIDGLSYLSWAATELDPLGPGEEDDGGIPESPFTIKPGVTLSGFSFQSLAPPGNVTFYAQGYVPLPQASDPEDFLTEGYDLDLLDFRQNSDTGLVVAPVAECGNGLDDDGDGATDFPTDTSCRNADWPFEASECANNIDDDGDTLTDSADPNCHHPYDRSETPDCADGLDNDFDGLIDFPNDTDCNSASDETEAPDCSDGFDNDGDGLVDLADVECSGPLDLTEAFDCADGVDNDGDGDVDAASDPGCKDSLQAFENPQCDDGIDNDGDGLVDWDGDGELFGADPECGGVGWSDSEFVPEPSLLAGLGAGTVILSILARCRKA